MQTEPIPLLIRGEPTPGSKDELDRCDMCNYKSLCEQWTWDDMHYIIQEGLYNAGVETSVDFVKKLECLCNNPLLSDVMTSDILSSIDVSEWFILDYSKIGGYYREDPITKEQVRVPRRRVYFWDDELTDYEALCQTIVNILSVIDDWVWEQDNGENCPVLYYKIDGEKTMIASIIDIYDTMIDMYFTEDNEECDSIS